MILHKVTAFSTEKKNFPLILQQCLFKIYFQVNAVKRIGYGYSLCAAWIEPKDFF
jgi:hypothetical protein